MTEPILPTQRLSLEWQKNDSGSVSLIFTKATWLAYEQIAKDQGLDAQQLITRAVAFAAGTPIYTAPKWRPE